MTQTAAPAHDGVSVEDVDRPAVERNVDALARRFLGMTGEIFLLRRERGEFQEAEDSPALCRVLSAAALLD